MSKTGSGLLVVCFLLVVSVLSVTAASAAVLTITLDAGTIPATVVNCGDEWTESGVTMKFVATTPQDCTDGSCFWGIGGLDPNGVDLYPARLHLDLSSLPGQVLSAEVDVTDYCGNGCTRAFLLDARSCYSLLKGFRRGWRGAPVVRGSPTQRTRLRSNRPS